MTTLDIEIALMELIGVRKNIIVTGIHWGLEVGNKIMHECDLLILSKSNYATEIEIKISKADLLKDKFKTHGHNHSHIKYLWFAVTEELKEIALQEIPDRSGLYSLSKINGKIIVDIEKKAIAIKAIKWTDNERNRLMRLGTMRIITLKKKIQRLLT